MKAAGFKVLTAPDVPSVLVELGYMSTKDEPQAADLDGLAGKTAAALAQASTLISRPGWRGAAGAN